VERDLAPTERAVVNSTIQFNFGNQHKKRIEDWYQHILPHYRVIAQSRSYEVALSMVQAGLGVAVVPALTAALGAKRGFAVTLYRTTLPNREIVALLPTQYARIEPYVSVVEMVKAVGATIPLPPIEPLPPLLKAL
jgi:DNA-binding transcriptional LysR family regulator